MDEKLLQSLADKQAIYEVLVRYCRGIDRFDMDLVRSSFHPDAIDNHTGYIGTAEGFFTFVEPHLRSFAGSMHILCNHLSEIDGDVAACETYALAIHWDREGQVATRNMTMGFRYVDHMTRRNGLWKIQERWVACEWAKSDLDQTKLKLEGPVGTRGPDDPLTALRAKLGFG